MERTAPVLVFWFLWYFHLHILFISHFQFFYVYVHSFCLLVKGTLLPSGIVYHSGSIGNLPWCPFRFSYCLICPYCLLIKPHCIFCFTRSLWYLLSGLIRVKGTVRVSYPNPNFSCGVGVPPMPPLPPQGCSRPPKRASHPLGCSIWGRAGYPLLEDHPIRGYLLYCHSLWGEGGVIFTALMYHPCVWIQAFFVRGGSVVSSYSTSVPAIAVRRQRSSFSITCTHLPNSRNRHWSWWWVRRTSTLVMMRRQVSMEGK